MPDVTAKSQSRIAAIDALRGFALIGIFFFNITVMGGPIDSEQPLSPPDLANVDWQVWWASSLFIRGAMRGLFSLLFGASTLLFLRESQRTGAYLRRCFWLFLFGVANSTLLLWPGDILIIYATAGPVLLLFRNANPRTLLIAAGAVILVLSVWAYVNAMPDAVSSEMPDDAQALSREAAARLGSYFQNLSFMWHKSLEWTLDIGTLKWVLDAAAFMLVGMALYRLGLLNGAADFRIYLMLALVGFGLGLPLRAWETWSAFAHDGEDPPFAAAVFQSGRLLMTLGWLGAFMMAWQKIPWRMLFSPLSALGRMALSGYLAQSAIAAIIFSGFGLGLWNTLSWPWLWLLVPLTMAMLAGFSMLWLSHFTMGPLEWIWRTLTFGHAPRLRKAT